MSTYKEFIELKKRFKATDITIKKVIDIMLQDDSRYVYPWNTIIAAGFVDFSQRDRITVVGRPWERTLVANFLKEHYAQNRNAG